MLETSWLTGLGGAVGGAGIGYVQYRNVDAAKIAEMRRIAEYDSRQVRLDDYAIIGGVLGALLTPAVLYSRARLVHLILGGATWGVGVGAGTHWYDLLSTSERMF
ncbi:hypothetical protein FRB99_005084 [Tulasnella sp. 403]|nr:hypothetical protein FRB99_005084 [Tulasnella sp. 403]